MTPRYLRTAPALALAAGVIALSVGGSAVAGSLVTSKDIKNETIVGADVKNGSIGAQELAGGAKNAVKEADGDDQNLPGCDDTALDDCLPVVALTLGKGTWLVHGDVVVDNFAGPATDITNRCGLYTQGSVLAEARTPLAANGEAGEAESISLTDVVVVTTTGGIQLRCTEMPGDNLRVNSPTLTAVRVK